jgi:hypothetical protein
VVFSVEKIHEQFDDHNMSVQSKWDPQQCYLTDHAGSTGNSLVTVLVVISVVTVAVIVVVVVVVIVIWKKMHRQTLLTTHAENKPVLQMNSWPNKNGKSVPLSTASQLQQPSPSTPKSSPNRPKSANNYVPSTQVSEVTYAVLTLPPPKPSRAPVPPVTETVYATVQSA